MTAGKLNLSRRRKRSLLLQSPVEQKRADPEEGEFSPSGTFFEREQEQGQQPQRENRVHHRDDIGCQTR